MYRVCSLLLNQPILNTDEGKVYLCFRAHLKATSQSSQASVNDSPVSAVHNTPVLHVLSYFLQPIYKLSYPSEYLVFS